MSHDRVDPWAGEKMSRSDAQRKYASLIQYQVRPMVGNRSLSDDARIQVIKRVIREAHRTRYESGAVPQTGSREEITDLLRDYLKPEHWASEELKSWIVRVLRAYGALIETSD